MARLSLIVFLIFALQACAATKIVTIPVKAAAKTVETAVDIVD